MTEELEIFYKNLRFKVDEQLSYLEAIIDDINFSNQESYISSASLILEFVLIIHPQYLILNREKHKFTITSRLFPFTTKNIIAPLKLDGVRKVICIGSDDEYQNRYSEIEKIEPFVKWANSKQSAIDWIKSNEE